MLRILLVLAFAAVALLSGSELYQREVAGELLVTDEPLEEADRLLAAGHFDEAALMARFAEDTAHNTKEREAARVRGAQIEAAGTLSRHAHAFAMGALSGEPRDFAGFLGSLSLDLFVVGDIRDLAVQGYREASTGDGDMLILALSAVGLATTLSPHLDFAPALLKTFRRTGALGERFVKSFSRVARRAVSGGDFSRVGKITTDFGTAARALGPAPLARVMKHVDEPAELARVSKLAKANPPAVYGLTRMTNGRAVKAFSRTADAGRMAKAARRGSRLAKIFAKSVAVFPDGLLIGVFLASAFIAARLLAGLIPAPARRRRDIPVLTHRVASP